MQKEDEAVHRIKLMELAQAMHDGNLPFLEGAVQVLVVKAQLSNVAARDPDFDIFVAIQSETDHLPLQAQRSLWDLEALVRLQPELDDAEDWAKSFAPSACEKLIARFGRNE
jgi:hypothetical protein